MQTIEIKPDVMLYLCQIAEQQGRTITEVLDEMLRTSILKNGETNEIAYACCNCRNQVEYDINGKEGYCDYCESIVFTEKTESYP